MDHATFDVFHERRKPIIQVNQVWLGIKEPRA